MKRGSFLKALAALPFVPGVLTRLVESPLAFSAATTPPIEAMSFPSRYLRMRTVSNGEIQTITSQVAPTADGPWKDIPTRS